MRRTTPAIAALGLALALGLSGCFANPLEQLTEGLVEGGVEQLLEDQTGVDVDLNGTGASLPDNWPADVPIPDGQVTFSAAIDGTFSAAFSVSSLAEAEATVDELVAAGYELTATFDIGEGNSSSVLDNGVYNIALLIGANEDGTAIVQYTIAPVTP